MALEQTYQLEKGPPWLDFSQYAAEALRRFSGLLREDPGEPVVQRFFESHPSFVPGGQAPGGGTTASRLYCMLVSQPELSGLGGRRPDFLWFTANSDTWFPTLIEIERPSKRIFRRDGTPGANFNQSRHQLAQWRAWFSEPDNQVKFRREYGVSPSWTDLKVMRLRMILIYGRRSEFEDDPSLTKARAALLPGDDEELMSYDRLCPDPLLADALTVCAIGPSRYRALAVPPTLRLGPDSAERLLLIEQLTEAIDSSIGWSPERREFVKSRLSYWREWAREKRLGWITAGDWE